MLDLSYLSLVRPTMRNLVRNFSLKIDLPSVNVKGEKVLLLANGPSLTLDLQGYPSCLRENIFVVNDFANSDYFPWLKPNWYLLLDQVYFRSDVSDYFADKNDTLYKNLNKVSWPLVLLVPKTRLLTAIKRIHNKRISIMSFDYCGAKLKRSSGFLYGLKEKIICPPFINSIIPALFILLHNNVGRIELLGADFSQHEGLLPISSEGLVESMPEHFYKENNSVASKLPKYRNAKRKKVSTRFHQLAIAHESLELIRFLADQKNVEIQNNTKRTFIDAL